MVRFSKSALVALFACVLWLGTTNVRAGSTAPADRDLVRPSKPAATANRFPTRKLGRGFANVIFGVIEVPKAWVSINREYGGAAGLTWGTALGVKRCLLREVIGIYEIFTFWFRQGTIIEPEFLFMPEERVEWRVQDPRSIQTD